MKSNVALHETSKGEKVSRGEGDRRPLTASNGGKGTEKEEREFGGESSSSIYSFMERFHGSSYAIRL